MLLKAEGAMLQRPALPITALPVRAQLVSSTGTCWETPLDMVRRNTATTLLATN